MASFSKSVKLYKDMFGCACSVDYGPAKERPEPSGSDFYEATSLTEGLMGIDFEEKAYWRKEFRYPQGKEEKKKWKEERLARKLEKQMARQQEEEQKLKHLMDKKAHAEEVRRKKGRHYTVSVALPGSILDNAQSPELRTYLAGQIARACVIFNVDEIVIFDESGSTQPSTEGTFTGVGKKGNANVQIARILQYLECPQYLRKVFFPKHQDLQYAGLLNPLDCPHHVREHELSEYREGVVLDRPTKEGKGSFVNVGMRREVRIDKVLQPGLRVTVQLDEPGNTVSRVLTGKVVSPSVPRTEAGLYWGYTVRLAPSLGAVFTESPFKGGYDLTIGTSERGESTDDVFLPSFSHLLIVFGGLRGLEYSVECDEALDIADARVMFHYYLNTCPTQGSRTIRTEEAILISLSGLRPKIHEALFRTNTLDSLRSMKK
ncbi:PREDICTED: putative methyltransferase C9orf114 [Branchiostoma belcheri]|uniref:28S rRNA (uridine-N(3))-methyltransferase n=1 Tax=Branchiostoma belcheri TaxID=7741 RepID=A0A6P4Y4V1_BRABE|nr:PREDICTED: putative methyltransferase C9orf114 [Branchiostoma belcheri]